MVLRGEAQRRRQGLDAPLVPRGIGVQPRAGEELQAEARRPEAHLGGIILKGEERNDDEM